MAYLSQPILVPEIPFEEMNQITNNFREDAQIGEGPYAKVYFGALNKDRKAAAIKMLKESRQSVDRFRAQVGIASAVSDPNVTNLLGYCIHGKSRFLAYEFASNGTLHGLLHNPRGVLSWENRVRIAVEAARGLEYLHEIAQVVHRRSIKSGNIPMFDQFQAKIADFDLTDLSEHPVIPEPLVAPEFDETGEFNSKTDVYGFGVVILELLTGRKAFDPTKPEADRNLLIWDRIFSSSQQKRLDMKIFQC